jgi:signal transduction histidine kinase
VIGEGVGRATAGSWFRDVAAAVTLMALAEFQMLAGGRCCTWGVARTGAAFALTAAQTLPIAGRRWAPFPILLATGCAALAQELLRVQSADLGTLGVLVAFYTVVSRGPRRLGVALGAVTAVGILVAKLIDSPTIQMRVDDLVFIYGEFAVAWMLGVTMQAARATAAAERAHIAREVHDVVSRSLSVMLVQAGAARANLDARPDIARTCLHSIDSVGRRAWAEMRGLLHLVRQEETGDHVCLQDISALVEPMRDAGLAVELGVTGAVRPLPLAVELCAGRIVQEALANALAHAGAVPARVSVEYGHDALVLDISNDAGPSPIGARAGRSPGLGLVAMRERVELLGGRFTAGARGDGFAVSARLPL